VKSALVDLDDGGASLMNDAEFRNFQRFIYERAGITLSSGKKALVASRLAKRLAEHGFRSYAEYFRLIASGSAPAEAQITIDLLTTNETYFFREPKHFDLLKRLALAERGRLESFRVWSAASSSGEEAYSIAMTLDDCLQGGAWEVLGTDISSRVLARARLGHYLMDRTDNIPRDYLRKYCRKGHGQYEGTLLVSRELRSRVRFEPLNLNEPLPQLGSFDVIFLRNVMIYFDDETKRQVVQRLTATLKPGGYFLIGHSETLNGLCGNLEQVAPAVYRASRKTRNGQ
jgi:chemotaxis protein methyltransferase CheR